MLLRKVFYIGLVAMELGGLRRNLVQCQEFPLSRHAKFRSREVESPVCRSGEQDAYQNVQLYGIACPILSYTPISRHIPSPPCILHSSAYNIIANPHIKHKASLMSIWKWRSKASTQLVPQLSTHTRDPKEGVKARSMVTALVL